MFDNRKLFWREIQLRQKFMPLIKKAKIQGNKEELECLTAEYLLEIHAIEYERRLMAQHRLIYKASRLLLPIPSLENKEIWEEDEYDSVRLLKPASVDDLRIAIRNELKARRDLLIGWIIPLIGLIGAITGLLAVWFRD